MRFGFLALLLPQPGQARGGAQFEGFRLLAAGHLKGLVERRFGLCSALGVGSGIGAWEDWGLDLACQPWPLPLQRQFPLQPVELSFPEAFARFVHYRPCLRERVTPLLLLPHFRIHLGQ